MSSRDKFLKTQKILHFTSIEGSKLHVVPVWYTYSSKKIYIGTNTKSQKVKNVEKNNCVAFCIDVGINSPDIYGVMGQGKANLILEKNKVKYIARKILLRYFKSIQNKSAKELLDDTDCIIEIIPEKFSVWNY